MDNSKDPVVCTKCIWFGRADQCTAFGANPTLYCPRCRYAVLKESQVKMDKPLPPHIQAIADEITKPENIIKEN